MVKIIHERERCIGCGACPSFCFKYWEMADDGKSNLKGGTLNSETGNHELELEDPECNNEAADACPVQCIIVSKE